MRKGLKRCLLEKLIVFHVVTKFLSLYKNRNTFTMFSGAPYVSYFETDESNRYTCAFFKVTLNMVIHLGILMLCS